MDHKKNWRNEGLYQLEGLIVCHKNGLWMIEAEKDFIKIVQNVKVMGDVPITIPPGMETMSPAL